MEKEILQQMSKQIGSHTKAIAGLTIKVNRLGPRFDKLETKFDSLETKVDKLENTVNKIAIAVVGHTEKMEEFVTKDEFNYKMNQFINGQDKILKIVTRLDEERLFSSERISRLEEKINI